MSEVGVNVKPRETGLGMEISIAFACEYDVELYCTVTVAGPEVVIADARDAVTENVPDVEADVAEFMALAAPTDMPSEGIVASEGKP